MKSHTKDTTIDMLDQYYGGDVPAYVKSAGKTYITFIIGSEWEGTTTVRIHIEDIVHYYTTQAGNMSSVIRCIAGVYGDWRNIDHLAEESLGWLQFINPKGMTSALRKGKE